MKHAPCKDCSNRVMSCHSKCKEYIDWKAEYVKEHEEILRLRNLDAEYRIRVRNSRKRFGRYK